MGRSALSIAGTSHQFGRSSSLRTAAAPFASSITGTSEAISAGVSASSPSLFRRPSMCWRRPGIGDRVAKSLMLGSSLASWSATRLIRKLPKLMPARPCWQLEIE